MLNQWMGIGRMGADPELRYTQSGKAVASFNLAVSDRFNKEHTNWIPIVIWGVPAENTAKYCKKGSQVALSGRLQQRNYDGKDGKKVYVLEVVADQIQFLDTKSEDKPQANSDPFANDKPFIDIDDSSLPFL